jgi:hypothetical protein
LRIGHIRIALPSINAERKINVKERAVPEEAKFIRWIGKKKPRLGIGA